MRTRSSCLNVFGILFIISYGTAVADDLPRTPFPTVMNVLLQPNTAYTLEFVLSDKNIAGAQNAKYPYRSQSATYVSDRVGMITVCLGGPGDPAGYVPANSRLFGFAFGKNNLGIPVETGGARDISRVAEIDAPALWQRLYPPECRLARTGSTDVPPFVPASLVVSALSLGDVSRIEVGGAYTLGAAATFVHVGPTFVLGPHKIAAVISESDGTFSLDRAKIVYIPQTAILSHRTVALRLAVGPAIIYFPASNIWRVAATLSQAFSSHFCFSVNALGVSTGGTRLGVGFSWRLAGAE